MTAVMARVWVDNGPAMWPPQGWHGLDGQDWPRTFEVWIKWDDEGERRRVVARQRRLVCEYVGYVGARRHACRAEGHDAHWAKAHALAEHPGERVRFASASPRWIWELLGFADLWDGRPRGWYEVLDGADPGCRAYEADALALGDRAACYLRFEGQA